MVLRSIQNLRESVMSNGTLHTRTKWGGMEAARSMISHVKLNSSYWGKAVATATYFRNCTALVQPHMRDGTCIIKKTQICASNYKVLIC